MRELFECVTEGSVLSEAERKDESPPPRGVASRKRVDLYNCGDLDLTPW